VKSLKQVYLVRLDIKCWHSHGGYQSELGWLAPGDIFVLVRIEEGWFYGLTKFGAVYTFNNTGCFHK